MYGVRSLLAFWIGGANIPSELVAAPQSPFSGRSGFAMVPVSPFARPRKWGGAFRRWRKR